MNAAFLDTHTAIVGASGAGKTVTAKGMVETMLGHGRHLVVIDPTGAWWGMQSNAAGNGPGFGIPVFGGLHGNLPLDVGDGAAVAAALLERRMSTILDLSEMHDDVEQREFMLAFVQRLRAKEPANFHLVVDEADEFCPQTAPDDVGFALTRAMAWIAKRGRLRGFVLTAITQRPADVAKAVLSQMQTIVTHQLIAPQDQAAIGAYLKAHAPKPVQEEVMGSLAGLGRGERWIYSPRLGVLERGVSPPLITFDSSATPAPGEDLRAPQQIGKVDVEALRAALGADRETANAATDDTGPTDTAELAALREQVAALQEEVASLRSDVAAANGVAERAHLQLTDWIGKVGVVRAAVDALERQGPTAELRRRMPDEIAGAEAPAGFGESCSSAAPKRTDAAQPTVSADPRPAPRTQAQPSASAMPAGAAAFVELLDRIAPARVTWGQAAAMIGRKATGGHFNSARKWLRDNAAIVEEGELIHSTRPAPSGLDREAALHLWAQVLERPAPAMLAALAAAPLTRDRLAEVIGTVARGGHWNHGLAQLRRNGLISEDGRGRLALTNPLPGEAAPSGD